MDVKHSKTNNTRKIISTHQVFSERNYAKEVDASIYILYLAENLIENRSYAYSSVSTQVWEEQAADFII